MVARRMITALLLALTASGVFTFWMSRKVSKNAVKAAPAKIFYVTAAGNVEPGQLLQPANLKLAEWSSTTPLQGAFTKIEQVQNRTLLYPLTEGEPVLERHLATAGLGSGLATRIPDGMRAISLKSDQVVGVAGFLQPGTRVDVLVTYQSIQTGGPVTTTVLQDVQVLTAGQKTNPDADGHAITADVVTLLVTPEEAEKVTLASAQGTVHFLLRNGADHAHQENATADLSQLSGARPQEPARTMTPHRGEIHPVNPAPKPYTVQTIQGKTQTTEQFQ